MSDNNNPAPSQHVQRFDLERFMSCGEHDAAMTEHPEGDWVKFEDVADLIKHPSPSTHLEGENFTEAVKIIQGLAEGYREIFTAHKGPGTWYSSAMEFLARHRHDAPNTEGEDTISLTRDEVTILLHAPNFEVYETVVKRLTAFHRSAKTEGRP